MMPFLVYGRSTHDTLRVPFAASILAKRNNIAAIVPKASEERWSIKALPGRPHWHKFLQRCGGGEWWHSQSALTSYPERLAMIDWSTELLQGLFHERKHPMAKFLQCKELSDEKRNGTQAQEKSYAEMRSELQSAIAVDFGMTLLTESFTAFQYNSEKRNCRIQVLHYAQEVEKEVTELMENWYLNVRQGCRGCECKTILPLQELQKKLKQFIADVRFDAYSQSPWICGTQMLDITIAAADAFKTISIANHP